MVLNLYNTKSRSVEVFTPQKEGEVSLYTCGPTVYNYPHIGNYRAYLFADTLKRVLGYNGFRVEHIMNLTDIDDKTIRDSQKEGRTLKEFTEFYTQAFFDDRDALNIIPAREYTKATDYVVEMLTMIETLIEKGFAYISEDGSVYFSIAEFPKYGSLARIDLSNMKENASGRIDSDEYEKDNVQDFALWKSWDTADGDVCWEPSELLGHSTDIQKGRPGWHIECSAMSIATLGETIDIHTGGIDNMFPHHENEVAQSECATGEEFVRYFIHNQHLLVDDKKMSKSLGNFYTLRQLVEKGFDPIAFRYLMHTASYRVPLNFTFAALEGAQTALNKIRATYLSFGEIIGDTNEEFETLFREAVNDDLNIPKALGVLWTMLADTNVSNADKKATLLAFDTVLGFGLAQLVADVIPDEVQQLVATRSHARLKKDFAESDRLRKEIEDLGFDVKDTNTDTQVTKRLR